MANAVVSPVALELVELNRDGSISNGELAKLRRACKEHGFVLLNNKTPDGGHHIEPAAIEHMWTIAKALFDAPLEEKQRCSIATTPNNRGYFSSLDHEEYNKDPTGFKIKDNKEGFFFGSANLIAPPNVAPAGLEAQLAGVESYMEKARAACVAVMRAIVKTGLLINLTPEESEPDTFVERYLADPVYMLKTLKYPPTDGNTDAHTDYGCITLLLPGDDGLQVHIAGTWHAVPLVPDAFVINFGDLLQMWAGNQIKSTIHRVIYNSPNQMPRFSIPFFLHPSRGSTINCGATEPAVDSYSYVLSRFDKTYKHRKEAAAQPSSAQA